MSRAGHKLLPIAMVLVLSSACGGEEPPFPLRYETEHLRIGLPEGEELCEGDLAAYERHLTNVEGWLDAPISGKVDVYLWRFSDYPQDMYCPESGGCYFSDPPTIYSGPLALTHELVHAVASPLGDPAPMWSEGIAEALDIRRTFAGSVPPTENIHRPLDEVSYGSAGHFVRWAWDTYGPEVVHALLVDTREPEVAFEALTGQTLAEAEVDYYASAPYSYAPLAACEAPTLTKRDANSWEESITLDCGDEWTRVGIGQLGSSRVFEIEARSDFGFVSDAASMVIIRCPDEDLVEKPEDDDPAWGDVPPLTSVWPEGYVRALETGGSQDVLDLVPGRYELAFSLEAAGEVMLEVVDLKSP